MNSRMTKGIVLLFLCSNSISFPAFSAPDLVATSDTATNQGIDPTL